MNTTLSRKEAEGRRLRAMALLDQGWTQSELADRIGVTPGAVSQWVKARRKGGDAALKAKPHPGPKPKLNDGQLKRLEKMLLQGPRKHGHTTELWTLPRVVALVQKRFGVTYDPSGIWHVMKRLGFSCQKPERRARERDEEAILRWRKKDWPRIKKSAT